jgi:hypothetical protein
MAVQPPVAGSSAPPSLDQARQRIESLVRDCLLGMKINVVTFVEELLAITLQAGQVCCSRAADHGLRFQLDGEAPFEVYLDGNRGKLRLMCARLAVLCMETDPRQQPNPDPTLLYGGEGSIRQTWHARWSNTPDKHEFSISALR